MRNIYIKHLKQIIIPKYIAFNINKTIQMVLKEKKDPEEVIRIAKFRLLPKFINYISGGPTINRINNLIHATFHYNLFICGPLYCFVFYPEKVL